jgi:hypothetical protein
MITAVRLTAGVACLVALISVARVADADVAWPLETIDRPLTMPRGGFQAGVEVVGLPVETQTLVPGVGYEVESEIFDRWLLTALAGYGITDDLELLASYSFALHDFEAKGAARLGAGYVVARATADSKLDAVIRAEGGWDLLGEQVGPVLLGGQIQYRLSPTLAVVSPGRSGSWLTIALHGPTDAAGYELKPIFIDLPIGLLYQASPSLFAQVDTRLARLEVKDSDTSAIGIDYVLLNLTVGYSVSRALDIGLVAGADLYEAPDTAQAGVFVRYYGL